LPSDPRHAWNALPATDPASPQSVSFYTDMTVAHPNGAPWIKPGSSWGDGTDFVTVDRKPRARS
jgi:hypothetical protein